MTAMDELAEELGIKPALDAYSAELDQHGHDWRADSPRCVCGWTPARPMRSPRHAVGLHVTAAHKRAGKTYEAAVAAVIVECRR